MTDKRQVQPEEGQELADQFQMPFIETSAKQSLNVGEAFVTMTKEIKEKNINIVKTTKLSASSSSLGQGRALERPAEADDANTPLGLKAKSPRKRQQGSCC
jgi:hypothetical protein